MNIKPRLLAISGHAKLYSYQSGNQEIKVVYASGNAHEIGKSTGYFIIYILDLIYIFILTYTHTISKNQNRKLMRKEIQENIKEFYDFVENNLEFIMKHLKVPKFLAKLFSQYSIDIF